MLKQIHKVSRLRPHGISCILFDSSDCIHENLCLWYVSCSTHNPLRRWSCTKWPCRRLFWEQWSSCLLTSALSGFLVLLRVQLWQLTAQNKTCIISFSELPSATNSTKGPLPILGFSCALCICICSNTLQKYARSYVEAMAWQLTDCSSTREALEPALKLYF